MRCAIKMAAISESDRFSLRQLQQRVKYFLLQIYRDLPPHDALLNRA
jgi:hypothetical protein